MFQNDRSLGPISQCAHAASDHPASSPTAHPMDTQTHPSAPVQSTRASVGASTPETRHHNPILSPSIQLPHPLPLGLRSPAAYDKSSRPNSCTRGCLYSTELVIFFSWWPIWEFGFNQCLLASAISCAFISLHKTVHSLILRHLSGPHFSSYVPGNSSNRPITSEHWTSLPNGSLNKGHYICRNDSELMV